MTVHRIDQGGMLDMRKRGISVLAVIFLSIAGFSAISEARTMSETQTLDARQQGIVPIAAFTASGDIDRLTAALDEGLNNGLSINEIKEILVQMYAYAGFPRSLNGLGAFMNVVEERRQKGIRDTIGQEASPLPADSSSLDLGTEVQTKLVGAPVRGKLLEFAPAIDVYLKAHLFGDIFGRDNLDHQSREIATIAALAAMNGVTSQLQSHFSMGMNAGLTEGQLKNLISVLGDKVGKTEADRATEVLDSFLSTRSR